MNLRLWPPLKYLREHIPAEYLEIRKPMIVNLFQKKCESVITSNWGGRVFDPLPSLRSDCEECFPSVSPEKQKAQRISAKPLKTMVPPERLELPTH